jgi:vacuolar-type H+-ATPase subunit E/Vma4
MMETQGLLAALAQEAEAERQTILGKAQAEARETIEKAQVQAREIREQRLAASRIEAGSERQRVLGGAKQKAADLLLRTKEALLSKALEEARAELARRFEGKEGAKVLAALVEEALPDLGERFTLEVNPKDLSAAQALMREKKLAAEAKADPGVQHGARLRSGDGKLVILNTLESRLVRASAGLRVEVGRLLFRA